MEVAAITFVFRNVLFDFVERCLTIHCMGVDLIGALNAKITFNEHFKSFNVKNLVVDD